MITMSPSSHIQYAPPRERRASLALALLMLLALAATWLQPHPYLAPLPDLGLAVPVAPLPAAPVAPPYALPLALAGKPEVARLRGSHSATFDMGDGTFALLQSDSPLHYQDEAGAWQPIDASFSAAAGGWLNSANSVRTGLARHNSTAKLTAAKLGVAWQPLALLASGDAGEHTIAAPLPEQAALAGLRSDDGRIVRYEQSWSLAGLQDQWQIAPGSSAYSLRLPARPDSGSLAAPEQLELAVRLNLLPGTRVEVDGRPAALPAEATGVISFVNEAGERLDLEPAYAYEQGRFAIGTPGSYRLSATDDPRVIELRVRVPWQWLAAPERQYPVIVDPRFIVRASTMALTYDYPRAGDGSLGDYRTSSVRQAGVWGDPSTFVYVSRLAVRFDMASLPPGAQLGKAYFTAIPSGVNRGEEVARSSPFISYNDTTLNTLLSNVQAYPILDNTWAGYPFPEPQPRPDAMQAVLPSAATAPIMAYSSGRNQQTGVTWDVSAHLGDPNVIFGSNPGFLLRAQNEGCSLAANVAGFGFCGLFYFDDDPDSWSDSELFSSLLQSQPDQPHVLPSEKGGLRLLVFYSAPTLSVDAPREAGLPYGSRDPYYWAHHNYRLEPLPQPRWYAVAARGLGQGGLVQPPPDNGSTYQVPLAGSVKLRLEHPSAGDFPAPISQNQTLQAGAVSYIAFNGRGAGSLGRTEQLGLRVESGDQNADPKARPVRYDIRLIDERASISTVGQVGQVVPASFTMSSGTPMEIVNLNLPPEHNNRVIVRFSSVGPYYGAPYLKYLSGSIHYSGGRPMAPASDPAGTPVNTIFQSAAGGNYGLAIVYNGPHIFTNELPPPPEFAPDGQPPADVEGAPNEPKAGESAAGVGTQELASPPPGLPELQFQVEIEVISCGPGEIPTSGGGCQPLECPDTPAPAGVYQQSGGLGMWSLGGWTYADAQQNEGTSRLRNAQNELNPAVLIGGPNQQSPTVAVINGVVSYNKAMNRVMADTAPGGQVNDILLIDCTKADIPYFHVHSERMQRDTRTLGSSTLAVLENINPLQVGNANPWYDADVAAGDLSQRDFYINPAQGLATGWSTLRRRLDSLAPFEHDLSFRISWSLGVNGWLAIQSTIGALAGNPQPPAVASLSLALGSQLGLDIRPAPSGTPEQLIKTTPRKFQAVRARQATVTQTAGLGGASGTVQAVLLPRGIPRPSDPPASCSNASCLDLRGPADSATILDRIWAMPDIKTSGQAGMQVFSREGEALVFSRDHPYAAESDGIDQSLSFEGHEGSVSVQEERCVDDPESPGYDPAAPVVSVVRGEVRVALPNIGSSGDPSSLVAASFKLCEGTLRSVHLAFKSPVGVPIATSGLFLTGLDGGVDIFPDYTQIRVGVTFQAAQGGDGGVFTARGQVLIDTRGLFEFQGNAKIMGLVNAQGRIWVAWNPLDVGLDATISVGDWLSGRVYAHMWRGQGWGNKYTWLPNNGAMHFAGMIQATVTIPEGAVVDVWGMTLPPSDISIGVELAFGEFCTNDSCTQYEWGIKGKLIILGFDIGLYYGFEEGLDFILGNDDHILIDQHNGSGLNAGYVRAARASGLHMLAAPQQAGGVAMQDIPIAPEVEQILAGFTWMAGSPRLSLVRPDGVEVTPENAAQYGAQFHLKADATLVGLRDPQPGLWRAKFSNLSADGSENYTFLFLANRGAPGDSGAQLQAAGDRLVVQPGVGATQAISWQVPAGVQPHHTISLFYRRTEVITGTLHQDVPIVRNQPYAQGSFQWDTAGMLNGAYQVYAVVDDGRNALPAQEISIPNDSCIPLYGPYPRARAFDAGRFPGTEVFSATTTVQINDLTPPPAPQGLELLPDGDGLRVRWQPRRNLAGGLDADVSSYRLRWGPQTGAASFQEINFQELSATESPALRIGGLRSGQAYGVAISALDANGNASPESAAVFATAGAPNAPIPLAPVGLARTGGDSASVGLSWAPNPQGAAPSSYRLTYTRLGVGQGLAAQQDAGGPAATIAGLSAGAAYDVEVAALNAAGWTSAVSGTLRVVVSDGVDANGDGLPDDWAAAHQVSVAGADNDGDGLTNGEEYALGTAPLLQDSDGDGQSDGEEHAAGSDPLKDSEFAAEFTQPRLSLSESTLTFRIRPGGGEQVQASAAPQAVAWRNIGGGTLQLQASSASPWIQASVVGSQLQVSVDAAQLQPGFHSGVVALRPAGGSLLIGQPQCVRVKTWVYPAVGAQHTAYLPLVIR